MRKSAQSVHILSDFNIVVEFSPNREGGHAISLSNCFACGIFLSSCFLGLLPHIRKHEEHIRSLWTETAGHSDLSSHIFLNSELIVLMGFLLILLLEELRHWTIILL
ncbi:unnamed protein product [Litomosoides sigmodontis]|uniref:Uncharacterized protein n=1 Tax=Litomosoides sigmodontis TaxID=42156 RepID=A0A3P6U7G0_LITSI|nr:unnamed protein product [Litomosoides sigmodontis]